MCDEIKKKYERSILEYTVLIKQNPSNKFYKIAEFVLSQEYPNLFGDEAYGKFLANKKELLKPIQKEYEENPF